MMGKYIWQKWVNKDSIMIAIFAQTYLIFHFTQVIKDYKLFVMVAVLLLIDAAILSTWKFLDPLHRSTKNLTTIVSFTFTEIQSISKVIPQN